MMMNPPTGFGGDNDVMDTDERLDDDGQSSSSLMDYNFSDVLDTDEAVAGIARVEHGGRGSFPYSIYRRGYCYIKK